jgi:hypothetical protein
MLTKAIKFEVRHLKAIKFEVRHLKLKSSTIISTKVVQFVGNYFFLLEKYTNPYES